ncbi:MAG: hypothetical protein JWP25_6927 [Bradyrhizobium sp.]|nr:hypothetical protein [Bradyrhizobium sp.]
MRSSEGLERDFAEFPCELRVAFRELFEPAARVACKHGLLNDGFGRALPPVVDEEEIPRQIRSNKPSRISKDQAIRRICLP